MQKIKIFIKTHIFLLLIGIAGTAFIGWYGLLSGCIAGELIDQLIQRLRKRNEEPEKQTEVCRLPAGNDDYKILGLSPDASSEEIRKVYHNLASYFHPDATGNLSKKQQELSEEAFKKITDAYERINKERS